MFTSLAAVFSPMPGDAGEVVARVAAQRRVLRVLRGRDAGALEDPGLVVERVVGDAPPVVEHLDVRVGHQLVAVAVAGDDDHVDAVGRGARRQAWRSRRRPRRPGTCSVGMCSASTTSWIKRDLRHEDVGRLLAGALVVGVELVPEVRPGRVEHDRDAVGLLVAEHLHQHRREPEHRVRDRALGRGQVGRAARRRRGTRATGRRSGGASTLGDRYASVAVYVRV